MAGHQRFKAVRSLGIVLLGLAVLVLGTERASAEDVGIRVTWRAASQGGPAESYRVYLRDQGSGEEYFAETVERAVLFPISVTAGLHTFEVQVSSVADRIEGERSSRALISVFAGVIDTPTPTPTPTPPTPTPTPDVATPTPTPEGTKAPTATPTPLPSTPPTVQPSVEPTPVPKEQPHGKVKVPCDFNGDGVSELASATVRARSAAALTGGKALPTIFGEGDFDGDGTSDPVAVTLKKGQWLWNAHYSLEDASAQFSLGGPTALPLVGDIDGDNRSDVGTFDKLTGTWQFRTALGMLAEWVWGGNGDTPVLGDVDGDGLADYGVWRPKEGLFAVVRSSDQSVITRHLGRLGDIPVLADFTGDGKVDLAVTRVRGKKVLFLSSESEFSEEKTTTLRLPSVSSTSAGRPVLGDFDGDGKVEIALWDLTKRRVAAKLSSSGRVVTKRLRASAPACLLK